MQRARLVSQEASIMEQLEPHMNYMVDERLAAYQNDPHLAAYLLQLRVQAGYDGFDTSHDREIVHDVVREGFCALEETFKPTEPGCINPDDRFYALAQGLTGSLGEEEHLSVCFRCQLILNSWIRYLIEVERSTRTRTASPPPVICFDR